MNTKPIPRRALISAALVACAFLLGSARPARALPNSIGGNGFLGAANMNFEDFIASVAPWGKDAPLKGDWTPVTSGGKSETLKLKQTAVVFGLAAQEVTINKEDGALRSARIRFVDEKKGGGGNLAVRLRRAISAWAGADFPAEASVLKAKGVSIEVSGGGSSAEVVMRQAK